MSTSVQSTTAPDPAAERELIAKIRSIDFAFRDKIKARTEELTNKAGADALDLLLNPSKTELEQSARAAKARSDAITEGLARYISACRGYCDVAGAINTVVGVAESLETHRDYQRAEAQDHALKDLTGSGPEVADGRQRRMALNSHNRAEGTDEFVKLLRNAFASILKDSGEVA
jgi:hypothetical protein